MNNKHKYLPLAHIEAGAILADDLLDKLGHVLLPKGTTLTVAILKSIALHDIHQLSIISELDQGQNQGLELELEQIREHDLIRINKIFRHTPSEGPTVTLKSYIERYRKEHAS
ncbi:hypothetical protein [Undibacterium sp.]|uniref:hypothetical protein n=1 Tax=Undibacterium sp. TaxID=1914977 RepID=UPI00375343DA